MESCLALPCDRSLTSSSLLLLLLLVVVVVVVFVFVLFGLLLSATVADL